MSYEVMKRETADQISSSEEFMNGVIELAGLKQLVPTIKVKDEASRAVAAETRAKIQTLKKTFEEMRRSAKGPYLEMGRVVDNIFKPFLEDCKSLNDRIDGEYIPYVREQELVFAEQQKEAMRKQIEAKNAEETIVKAAMMQPGGVIETDSGKTFTRGDVEVEVVNEIKLIKAALDGRNTIPRDVVQINEAKLRQLCRGSMYSEKKWLKYGVRVVKVTKVQTRT